MNSKTKNAIGVVIIGIAVGLLGEMFPEALKNSIQNFFPLQLSLSFEWLWIFAVIILVLISVYFVWNYEKAESPPQPLPITTSPNSLPINPPPTKPKKSTPNMTKEQILSLIDVDIDKAFEVLDSKFEKKNAMYNALNGEYIDRPRDFSMSGFTSRLKLFVNRYC